MRPRPLQMHRFNQLVPARRRLERPRGPRIMRALHVPDQPEIFPVRIVFLIFFFLRLGDLPPVGIENALAVQIVRQIHRRVLIVLRILRAQRNRRRRRGQLLHLRPRKIVVARARVPRRPPAATPRKRRRRPAHVNARVVPSGRPVPVPPPLRGPPPEPPVVFASLICCIASSLCATSSFQVPQSSLRSGGFGSSAAIRGAPVESPCVPGAGRIGPGPACARTALGQATSASAHSAQNATPLAG
jgi:hypothetical protein